MNKWLIVGFAVLTIPAIVYIWLGNEMDKAAKEKANGTNDYVIILGAKVKPGGVPSLSLKYRLDVATDYLQQYPHVTAIVSGGQGIDEDQTEASVMYDYLVRAGIDAERILIEDKSTSTYENIKFSKQLLPENTTKITIVSNDFHLKRANILAKKLGLDSDVIAAPTPKVVELKSRIRERAALLKTYFLGQ
ncbi:YdcF family protein [Solibacillus sp. MA9]|uniref:YdcF family protein n=1 Tax=Solibacillus palustris TaxID=2908203 RepID=A0ABS9UCI0_9BACL|nr:YdcF family protein [Solibacillus sp. MA9]MCH7322046.1 YdcF family protein [Solibacillus sp. MA9]